MPVTRGQSGRPRFQKVGTWVERMASLYTIEILELERAPLFADDL